MDPPERMVVAKAMSSEARMVQEMVKSEASKGMGSVASTVGTPVTGLVDLQYNRLNFLNRNINVLINI